MDTVTYKSVLAIIDYLEEEKEHWECSGYPDNHIYHHIRRLAAWAADNKPTA